MGFRVVCLVAALTLLLLLVLPLGALVVGASWDGVAAAVVDWEVLGAIGVSLGCAAVAVAMGLVLGVPAGFLLGRGGVRGAAFWQTLIDLPLVLPHPVVGLGLLCLFAHRSLLGAALEDGFGVRVASAAPGIVIAMLVVSAPFIVKAARDGFLAVPTRLEDAARTLGASEGRVFWTVSLPLAWRGIGSGALLAWARAVSEFGSVVVLAYYPRTAPVLIWDRFSMYGLRAALAPAVVLMAVCAGVFVVLQSMVRRRR